MMVEENHSTLDHGRLQRQGFPEVVYCASKTAEQVAENLRALAQSNGKSLGTRLPKELATRVLELLPEANYDVLSQTITLGEIEEPSEKSLYVAMVTAGTSDLSVSSEAVFTLQFLGHRVAQINDVGVAGIHRLHKRMDEIRKASVVIVVAGMEGALPSVVGGLVASPVIAVPTSVGYGAAFEGVSALLGMLNSCASGLVVVNIDNGFGAAIAAHRIITQVNTQAKQLP